MMNNNGPKKEPLGTPQLTDRNNQIVLPNWTACFLSEWYDLNQFRQTPRTSYLSNFLIIISG